MESGVALARTFGAELSGLVPGVHLTLEGHLVREGMAFVVLVEGALTPFAVTEVDLRRAEVTGAWKALLEAYASDVWSWLFSAPQGPL